MYSKQALLELPRHKSSHTSQNKKTRKVTAEGRVTRVDLYFAEVWLQWIDIYLHRYLHRPLCHSGFGRLVVEVGFFKRIRLAPSFLWSTRIVTPHFSSPSACGPASPIFNSLIGASTPVNGHTPLAPAPAPAPATLAASRTPSALWRRSLRRTNTWARAMCRTTKGALLSTHSVLPGPLVVKNLRARIRSSRGLFVFSFFGLVSLRH